MTHEKLADAVRALAEASRKEHSDAAIVLYALAAAMYAGMTSRLAEHIKTFAAAALDEIQSALSAENN